MAGAVMNPVQATGPVDKNDLSSSPSHCNNLRISTVADRLLAHARSGSRSDNNEIRCLCLSLSRSIDFAVGNNEIPDRALQLPYLLKQVCQWTNDKYLQPAIMMLMISIKGGCRNGWFGEKDKEELLIIWNEISTSFCSVIDMLSEESTIHHNISTVMSRFYPRMKMGRILAFIETMPGYRAFVKDFNIAKNTTSLDERVCLFVAQTENTETSSCIISPQLVNFLLNGKAVDKRTCLNQDPGPQIPTPVTKLAKHGTNLLQAVGQFNGKYLIVVAFMSIITNPSCPALPDYVPPVAAASDPDNDIVEGASTVSLNCPISFKRITTPVKGHLCKHLQCFDFENYVSINSRRPSWRCPHCSQSVCFTDIRFDQGIAKVLQEVDATISHVKISADGSWSVVNEGDDNADKQNKSISQEEPIPPSNMSVDIMDLTIGDNDIDPNNSHKENDKKPSLDQLQNQPNPTNQIPNHMNMNHMHTNISPQTENRFFRPTSDTRSNVTISHSQTVNSGSNLQSPTYPYGTPNTVMNNMFQSPSQTQVSASGMQFQPRNMNRMSNDYGARYTTVPNRHVTRNPNAFQALPVQTPAGMVGSNTQQLYSGFQMDQHRTMRMITDNMGSQNWVNHDLSNVTSQPAQQFGGHFGQSHQSNGQYFNSHQHQSVNHMTPNLVQSPTQLSPQIHQGYIGSTPGHINNQQTNYYVGPTIGPITNQQTHHYANTMVQQAPQMSNWSPPNPVPQSPQISSWTPPVPSPLQTPVSTMPVTSSEDQRGMGQAFMTQEGSANAPTDQTWRPTGRMRGSLSGQAYTDAFNRSIVHPTQSVQAASPPVLNTPRPFIPAHLQVLMASNVNGSGFEGGSVVDGSGGAV